MHRDNWTDRQYMLAGAPYEIHHYVDEVPPHVNFHEHPFYELFFFMNLHPHAVLIRVLWRWYQKTCGL